MIYIHIPFCKSFCTYCDFYSEICRKGDVRQVQFFLDSLLSEIDRRRPEIDAALAVQSQPSGEDCPVSAPPGGPLPLMRGCPPPGQSSPEGSVPASAGPAEAGVVEGALPPYPLASLQFCSLPPRLPAYRHRPEGSVPASAGPAEAGLVDTLYIGGGTPSVLSLAALDTILTALGRRDFCEFTMEVNPDDITPEYASGLRALGVNRVSMGVQSLSDPILRWMNRRHDASGAERAFRTLRAAGFENLSVDVIFGISHLDDGTLEETVRGILAWRPEHISAYQLSIEEGSILAGMVASGAYVEASQEQCARQYDLICSLLRAAGYVHYEISNWALPGREAVHNSAYWSRVSYVGLGPGAHSLVEGALPPYPLASLQFCSLPPRLPAYRHRPAGSVPASAGPAEAGHRFANLGALPPYPLASRRSWNSCELSAWTSEGESLTPEEVVEETIMLGLRRSCGLPEKYLREHCPENILSALLSEGSLTVAPGGCLRIPEDRFFVSDAIIAALI